MQRCCLRQPAISIQMAGAQEVIDMYVLAPESHFSAMVANSALDKNRSTECVIQRLPAGACQVSVYQFILSRIINSQEGNTYTNWTSSHTGLVALLNRCHRYMLIQWLLYCTVHVASRKNNAYLALANRQVTCTKSLLCHCIPQPQSILTASYHMGQNQNVKVFRLCLEVLPE